MTAVDWLIGELIHKGLMALRYDKDNTFNELIEQAKQMEEEQIINSFDSGIENYSDCKIFDGKQYYNETYGSGVLTEGSGAVGDKGGAVTSSQTEISINELKGICQSVIDNTPSDATEKEIGYTKAMEHIIKIIDGELHKYPQTEISDEEIKKTGKLSAVKYLADAILSQRYNKDIFDLHDIIQNAFLIENELLEEISDEEIEKSALEFFADYKGGASQWEISAFIMGMKKYREQIKNK